VLFKVEYTGIGGLTVIRQAITGGDWKAARAALAAAAVFFALGSIADGKSLSRMGGLFDLVDERDRIVLERDAAALVVREQRILAQPEFAGALARQEHRRGRTASTSVPGSLAVKCTALTTAS
jgi:hypothetical protein